jgi:pimeloyl-ACP methyl ester carboxylesterase
MSKLYRIFYPLCCLLLCLGATCQAQAPARQLQPLPNGASMAYTEAGRGKETLILIHGLGGNQKHWQQNLPGLGKHFRVLALELPGYPQAPLQALPEGNMLQYWSEALLAFMDELGIEKAHLAGHSMGGQLALLFALEHPHRVHKLVLAAPAGLETFSEQEAAGLKAYAAASYPQKQGEEQIRQAWALNFSGPLPAAAEALMAERLQLNDSPYYSTYAQVLQTGVAGMLEAPVANRLGELQLPVLLLFGADDQLIPNRYLHPGLTTEAVAQQGKAAIAGSQLVLLPKAGHMLQFEQPEAFNRAVIAFLTQKSTTKKSTP